MSARSHTASASPDYSDLAIHGPRRGDKRTFEGECARTVCANRPAVYFNQSTLWYYCGACAKRINEYAGTELCVMAPGALEALARHKTDDLQTSEKQA